MRLLVAQRPQRRHLRIPGDLGVLTQNRGRSSRTNNEEFKWHRRLRTERLENSFLSGEIEHAKRLVDKHGPAARANGELHWHSGAVGGELIGALAVAHVIDAAAPIELRTALAQAKHGNIP